MQFFSNFFERDEYNNIRTVNNFAKAEVVGGIGATTAGSFAEFGLHNPNAAVLISAGGFVPLLIDSIVWRMNRSSQTYPWTKGAIWFAAATVPTAALALSGHSDMAAYASLATVAAATGLRADRSTIARRGLH